MHNRGGQGLQHPPQTIMNFILRVLTSFAVGLAVYLMSLCHQKGGPRHLTDLVRNPEYFFSTFDKASVHFDIAFSALWGTVFGICVFLFWEDSSRKW